MMKKIICALLVLLALNLQAFSQRKGKFTPKVPLLSLRTGISSWFDYDAGLMLGVNYRWSKHFSATIEPTWIFYNGLNNPDLDEVIKPSGYKLRADVRYHFRRESRRDPDFFLSPEFHYKSVNTEREDEFGINCLGGNCDYFQTATYTEKKKEIGGFIKAGILTPLSFIDKTDRLNLEVYLGVGVKSVKFTETNLPLGGSFVNPPDRLLFNTSNDADRSTATAPMMPFGLKLSFNLR
jgi:Protein of unknown function (DUF3575)